MVLGVAFWRSVFAKVDVPAIDSDDSTSGGFVAAVANRSSISGSKTVASSSKSNPLSTEKSFVAGV
jgi:hypothetical protein